MTRAAAVWGLAGAVLGAAASDLDEFQIKRQGIFEFERKPAVTRDGDRVTVAFATKGYCDVTVAVEDSRGKIVRHLASGVLGPRAPAPFQTNSLFQTLEWDGKNEVGEYIDDKNGLTVRVSLGLKPQFERTLFWGPERRIQRECPLIRATARGVYVFQGRVLDSVCRYDHAGEYRQTVYPFPADRLGSFGDLHWQTFPQDGKNLPLKEGFHQATLLSSGDNAGFDRVGVDRHNNSRLFVEGRAASAMAVYEPTDQEGFVALARLRLNIFGTDGSARGGRLVGPGTAFSAVEGGTNALPVTPRSAALSPDGKTLYLAGYLFAERVPSDAGYLKVKTWHSLHGVARVDLDGMAPAAPFLGEMDAGKSGADNRHFNVPTSVACDAQGRVYVSDYANDRIQVFAAEGTHLKTIPVANPSQVSVHQRTGDLYVLSSLVYCSGHAGSGTSVVCRVIQFGPFDRPEKKAEFVFPAEDYTEQENAWYRGSGIPWAMELDSWVDPPAVWLVRELDPQDHTGWRADYPYHNIRVFSLEGGKPLLKKDFGDAVRRTVLRESVAPLYRQRLYVNPATGTLLVGEGDSGIGKSFKELVEIDPPTGKSRLVALPFDAEDMAFDPEGYAYLRTDKMVVRYDPRRKWQEIPWDYGEERAALSESGDASGRKALVMSGLPLPSDAYWHHGGLSVSAKGHLAAACYLGLRTATGWESAEKTGPAALNFQPKLYPGRIHGRRAAMVHVWNRSGKPVYEDAVPGLGVVHGLAIDRDDNLYVLASATRLLDGKAYFNRATGTLLKLKAGRGRLIAAQDSPVPLSPEDRPQRPPALLNPVGGPTWVDGAEWFYGGVGFAGDLGFAVVPCSCANMRFALDEFGRSFVPETDHYSVAVLDTAGNLILRIGRYGNVDDGQPLVSDGRQRGEAAPRSIGGDEVALFHACYVATETDRRLYIADGGNGRIVSVRVGYHTEERVLLGTIADQAEMRK